jgi:transposase
LNAIMDGEHAKSELEPECPGCRELRKEVAELRRIIEELRRAGKRQAGPFSKGPPKPKPKRPGRKPGDEYGTQFCRAQPEQIDETYEAELPKACPHCGVDHVTESHTAEQFQTEVVTKVVQRKFVVHVGRCATCQQRVQGRHPLQTSDALGAASVQLGGKTHALIAWLNKRLGLSHGKVKELFDRVFGLAIGRATSCRSMLRTAQLAQPAVAKIHQQIRGSPFIVPDETGWRIGGNSAWLHVAVGERETVVQVERGRGHEPLARLIGLDYAGRLIHDGWVAYDVFAHAAHQQCLTHLSKRCKELLETATRGAVRFPRAVQALLRRGLAIRDRFVGGELSLQCLAWWRTRLTHQLSDLVASIKSHAANEKFAKFLERHVGEVFTFLAPRARTAPGGTRYQLLPAANYLGEQAIRPAVVNRKVWGGNRTNRGADAQSSFSTIVLTALQRALDPLAWLQCLRQSPHVLLLPRPRRYTSTCHLPPTVVPRRPRLRCAHC